MAADAQRRAEVDDAYRAIGRYVVAFSELVSEMRYLIGSGDS
jgi:hypothetical protein